MNFYDNEVEEEEEEEALVTIHRFISTFTMGQWMDDVFELVKLQASYSLFFKIGKNSNLTFFQSNLL